ncbi:MAG: helix-turn-helix transcriptional regulator [Pseudomonadota bacterium]
MTEYKQINKHELSRKLEDSGFPNLLISNSLKSNISLMTGNVNYTKLPSGLMVHSSDTIEDTNTDCGSKLVPRIMLCVLLEGEIVFSLDNEEFSISANEKPAVFAYMVNQPVFFTRRIIKGNRLKKINVSASKDWLLSRSSASQLHALQQGLFAKTYVVHDWIAGSETVDLALKIMDAEYNDDLMSRIECERLAFEMFGACFEKFYSVSDKENQTESVQSDVVWPLRVYEDELETLLLQRNSSAELAENLGVSMSTLQRYFKRHHNKSFAEYVREKRLEHARRSLKYEQVTIGEAAYNAGYNHVSNFVSAFKKQFNKTPSELKTL